MSNIVSIAKKNGKLIVYIDFRDLNSKTPIDMYVMLIVDMLVTPTANNELLFLDFFFGYNQIQFVVEHISKTALRCPGSIGTFE